MNKIIVIDPKTDKLILFRIVWPQHCFSIDSMINCTAKQEKCRR